MTWKRINIPDDPLWCELHKQVMSTKFGRCMLKVWLDLNDVPCWRASLTEANGNGKITTILICDGDSIKDVKRAAEIWAEHS